MYNLDFKKEFLEIDFDQLLLRFNNHYINDNIYTDYKKKYIVSTKENMEEYNKLVIEINLLNNKKSMEKSSNKYIYFIFDETLLQKTKQKCKLIICNQRKSLDFFKQYIDTLNDRFLNESNNKDRSIKSGKSMSIKSTKSKKSKKSKKNKNILSMFNL